MMGVIVDSVREGTIYETSQMIEPILYISTIVIGITIGGAFYGVIYCLVMEENRNGYSIPHV